MAVAGLTPRSLAHGATVLGSALAVVGTVHACWNLRRLRVPPPDPPPVAERVALLLPVRDEAARVEPCLRSLLAQTGVRDLTVTVLDVGSTDGTADVVRRVVGDDPRVSLRTGASLPVGWWGKPWACAQLSDAVPDATVLVFVDADVVLAPHDVAAAVYLNEPQLFILGFKNELLLARPGIGLDPA